MSDHDFEPCSAGSLTSDAACYMVRKGGKRDLCHYSVGNLDGVLRLSDVCQRPESEHEAAFEQENERKNA